MAKKKRKTQAKVPASGGLLDTAELTGDADNPRTMTDKAAKGLGSSLDRFGDLSGIVWNRRSGELVAGHQRMAEIRKRWGDHPIQEIDQARGLYGIAVDDKHFFPVRVVDWSKGMQRAANVTANSQRISGEFTDDLTTYLLEIQAEVEEESPGLLTDLLLVDLMAAGLDDETAEDENQAQVKESYQIIVQCVDENHQRQIHEQLTGEGLPCKLLTI